MDPSSSSRAVLPAIRNLTLKDAVPCELTRLQTRHALSYPAVYPAIWAFKDHRSGFIKQARLLSSRKDAVRLVERQSELKLQAQKQLQHKVEQVTDTPLLEGGLYEYRRKQLKDRAKRLWRPKQAYDHKIKVKLHEYGPIKQEDEPVVYLNNVDGVRSLYKFKETDVFVPARKSHNHHRLPDVARLRRFPKTNPGMITKWV